MTNPTIKKAIEFLYFHQDFDTWKIFDQKLSRSMNLGVQNFDELYSAYLHLQNERNILTSDDIPLPDGFVAPRLAMPSRGFAPDYFTSTGFDFCSRRLRDALAQPEHVLQF